MSRHIVKVWNQTVAEDDILYCLGDWSFQGVQNIWNFRKQLRCRTIHLILGNHDSHIQKGKFLPNVYSNDEGHYLDGVPDPVNFKFEVGAKEVFSSVQDVLTVTHGKHTFFMSHYPHLSWHHAAKGVIMLHGHEHGQLDHLNINCKRQDVGIDSAYKLLGEYRPFSIEEVIDINSRKKLLNLGHHE